MSGSIHIPTGRGVGHRVSILFIVLTLALFATCAALAPEADAAAAPVITGNGWRSFVMLRGGTFQCPAQQLLPPPEVFKAPAYVDVSCLGAGVRSLNVDGYSDLYYRAATTSHMAVPALGNISQDNTVVAVSNDDVGTWINLLADGSAFVVATASDAAGNKLWSATIVFAGWTQVMVPVRAGLIVLNINAADGFGHTSPPVRGFVTYGLRGGGSDVVFPLK